MIQKEVFQLDKPDMEVPHIGPDQLPYVCIYESMERRVDGTISWHWHQYFEVAYVAEGELECRTPDQVIHLKKGEAVFINTGVLHMYQKATTPCVIYAHIFDSAFLTGTLSSDIYQKYIYPIAKSHAIQLQAIHPDNAQQSRMLDAIRNMICLARDEPFGYEFQLQAQLSQFWCHLLTLTDHHQPAEPSRSDNDIQRIKVMQRYIHAHYPRRITLKDIADAALISERECSRCFRRCFHESAIQYLNKHRIRIAAGMLLAGKDSIHFISESCGFSSVSYFGKLFYSTLGCTPKEYRKKATLPTDFPSAK